MGTKICHHILILEKAKKLFFFFIFHMDQIYMQGCTNCILKKSWSNASLGLYQRQKKKNRRRGTFVPFLPEKGGGGEIKTPSAFIKKGGGVQTTGQPLLNLQLSIQRYREKFVLSLRTHFVQSCNHGPSKYDTSYDCMKFQIINLK